MLLNELFGQYAGQPVVVMGGGPSLPSDLEKIENAAAYLSANEHGAMLRNADYIVCVDELHQRFREPMRAVLEPFNVPIISGRTWADYRITREFGIPSLNSGMTAICAAYLMGARPIIAAGFGMYQGGTYYHDAQAKSSGTERNGDHWLKEIAKLRSFLKSDCLRVASGPLAEHFPEYDPSEQFPEYETPAFLAKLISNSAVRVRIIPERTYCEGARLKAGDVIRVSEATAKRLINTGKARLFND